MSRREAYMFLVDNAIHNVKLYTDLVGHKNSILKGEKLSSYNERNKKQLTKWKAALSLLNEEKSFHMNMLSD